MKENRLLRLKSISTLGVVTLFLFSLVPGSVMADEMKWRIATYVAKMEMKPVGDVEGHVTGPFVRRGLAFFDKGDVAVITNSGILDMTKGKGSVLQSEVNYVFEDGSGWVTTMKGSFAPGPDGKTLYNITGNFIKGYGRFEGITGKITVSGKLLTPYGQETKGDAYFDVVADYVIKK